MQRVRVILADDHRLVRAGIRALLNSLSWVEVVGEANNSCEAIELLKKHTCDVLLTDIAMPGMTGLELTAAVTEQYPAMRVVLLSMHTNEEYVRQAIRAGAAGYLVKDAATTELELALQAVVRGENYLSPAVSKHLMDSSSRKGASQEQLTPRQREILQLIAKGNSTKEIARLLKISAKTVETHRSQLMQRLEIFDVPSLVRYAIRTGLVGTED